MLLVIVSHFTHPYHISLEQNNVQNFIIYSFTNQTD